MSELRDALEETMDEMICPDSPNGRHFVDPTYRVPPSSGFTRALFVCGFCNAEWTMQDAAVLVNAALRLPADNARLHARDYVEMVCRDLPHLAQENADLHGYANVLEGIDPLQKDNAPIALKEADGE